jgi:hypothetical protein
MYTYMTYRRMKKESLEKGADISITCGECKNFIPEYVSSIKQFRCKIFTLREVEEHTKACERRFDSHYEG